MRKIIAFILTVVLLNAGTSFSCKATDNKFVKIRAKDNASYALNEDGTVWKWGSNILNPTKVSDIPTDLFVTDDGLGKTYYFRSTSNVGRGVITAQAHSGVIEISIPNDIVKIRCAESLYASLPTLGAFVLRNDGVFGTLSPFLNEDGIISLTFSAAEEMTDVKDFGVSIQFSVTKRASGMEMPHQSWTIMVLKNDGTVWLQSEYTNYSYTPEFNFHQVEGLVDIESISLEKSHTLALDKNGDVWAWGGNDYGQLGNGLSDSIKYPTNVACIEGATTVIANNNGYMGALKNDGIFSGWEISDMQHKKPLYFTKGELQQSDEVVVKTILGPYGVSFQAGLEEITAGYRIRGGVLGPGAITAKLKGDGTVWFNGYIDSEYVQVEGLTDIIDIGASASEIYALKSDGTLWSINEDKFKQFENLIGIKSFACSISNIIAIKNDGSVIKYDRQTGTKTSFPQLGGAVSVDAAYFSSEYSPYYYGSYYCALKQDGSVWVWDDGSGLLRRTDDALPTKVIMAKAIYKINDPAMVFDGLTHEIDPGRGTAPILINDRTFLPARSLTEHFGGTISWNEVSKEVTISYNLKEIKLSADKNIISVNGKEQLIDVPPIIINDRTFLPLRAVMEIMDFDVQWDDSTYRVFINPI